MPDPRRVGAWDVLRPIGAGGMGKVLLGRKDGVLGAVKILRSDAEPDEEQRFAREVEALAVLDHPAIVRLLDQGTYDEAPFLVMEYAPGEDLEKRLARGEAIPPGQALPAFAALADGLRHAHEVGIHHRDVKADNVVVRPDGWASLVDFGVALKRGASRLTNAGLVMGTMAYLPPEVMEGGDRDPVQADIYALGQLLVEALTGAALFRGDPAERNNRKKWHALIAEKAAAGPLDPGNAFRVEVRAVCRRATAPEAEERYATVGEVADDLRTLLDPEQEAALDAWLGASWGGAPPVPTGVSPIAPGGAWLAVLAVGGVAAFGCGGILTFGLLALLALLLA